MKSSAALCILMILLVLISGGVYGEKIVLELKNPHQNLPYYVRGQMHAHTKIYDGDWSATELANIYYGEYNYSFLCITDHSHGQKPTKDPGIPGLLHILSAEDGDRWNHHMGVVGINITGENASLCQDDDQNGICDWDTDPEGNVQPRINFYNSQGAVVTLHHPTYKPYSEADRKNRSGYTAIEIWNTNTDGHNFVSWWDRALGYGHKSWAVAADDYETKDQPKSGGWILVNFDVNPDIMACVLKTSPSSSLSVYKKYFTENLLLYIKTGNFFAVTRPGVVHPEKSTVKKDRGPKIIITTSDNLITITLKSDAYENKQAFTLTAVTQDWIGNIKKWDPLSANVSKTIDIFGYTQNTPYKYRYIRFEISQTRHNELFTVYSQPIYITYSGVLIPDGFYDYNYENRDWLITKQVTSKTPVTLFHAETVGLFNNYNKQWVRYGERDYGINLVWTIDQGKSNKSITFYRKDGAAKAITYGEPFAIHVSGGGYVKYGEREYGINLVWSKTPVYEWVATGGAAGDAVYCYQPFGLRNTHINNEVVYREREYGINLKWRKDSSALDKGR